MVFKIPITCGLPISVGQAYHEGEKFKATIELVNSLFTSCSLIVCGSLQRHTLAIQYNLSDEDSYQLSIKLANEWVKRNRPIFEKLNNLSFSRWEDWLKHKDFSKHLNRIDTLCSEDPEFSIILKNNAEGYINRALIISQSDVDTDLKTKKCIDYIKEEIAMQCLWAGRPDMQYELYPMKCFESIRYIRDQLSDEYNFFKPKTIDFKRKKSK